MKFQEKRSTLIMSEGILKGVSMVTHSLSDPCKHLCGTVTERKACIDVLRKNKRRQI